MECAASQFSGKSAAPLLLAHIQKQIRPERKAVDKEGFDRLCTPARRSCLHLFQPQGQRPAVVYAPNLPLPLGQDATQCLFRQMAHKICREEQPGKKKQQGQGHDDAA